jgi:hypothetical protein
MVVIRQRLLLVAGWLLAVIGSVLVASGAVAIAGGQVLDRPLRPLTAAEVAALPVIAVGSADAIEPQASGGIAQSTDEPTVGSDETGTGTTGATSAGGSAGSSNDEARRWDRFTNPGSFETQIEFLEAGKASFAIADGELHLLWATPGAGYVMSTPSQEGDSITITFSSGLDVWFIEARLIDGSLEVESGPAPIA